MTLIIEGDMEGSEHRNTAKKKKKKKNKKTPVLVFNTFFINPDIYFKGKRQNDPERSKNERV